MTTRFWRNVEKTAGCWFWRGKIIRRHGYGVLYTDYRAGRTTWMRAHRLAYELSVGPIPAGAEVMHTCDVRHCVNPAHLRLGTHAENMRDMAVKGRRRDISPMTSCVRGHPFDDANTIWRKNGRRACGVCRRASQDAYRHRRRSAQQMH